MGAGGKGHFNLRQRFEDQFEGGGIRYTRTGLLAVSLASVPHVPAALTRGCRGDDTEESQAEGDSAPGFSEESSTCPVTHLPAEQTSHRKCKGRTGACMCLILPLGLGHSSPQPGHRCAGPWVRAS